MVTTHKATAGHPNTMYCDIVGLVPENNSCREAISPSKL
jgi:hypothetical protein